MRCVAAIIVLGLPTSALADSLYTFDLNSNRIVTVNTVNGDVTPVSPIGGAGFDATGQVDLTYANGFIYAVDYGFGFMSPSILYKISPQTGLIAALPKVIYRPDGESPNITEGVAAGPNGQLYVSYRGTSPDESGSDTLGLLNPTTGHISVEHSFYQQGQHPMADFEALAVDWNGSIFAMNNGVFSTQQFFYQLALTPPSSQILGEYAGSNSSSNDIVFGATQMFSISAAGSYRIHNPTTGQTLDSNLYDDGYVLNGLAYIPVPGPGCAAALLLPFMKRRHRTR